MYLFVVSVIFVRRAGSLHDLQHLLDFLLQVNVLRTERLGVMLFRCQLVLESLLPGQVLLMKLRLLQVSIKRWILAWCANAPFA